MKYILMMSATKASFEWYAKWPKEDLKANVAFMRDFNKELKDSGVLVSSRKLGGNYRMKRASPFRQRPASPKKRSR